MGIGQYIIRNNTLLGTAFLLMEHDIFPFGSYPGKSMSFIFTI